MIQKLKDFAQSNNYTASEMSHLIGIEKRTYSNIIHGKESPSKTTQDKINSVLQMPKQEHEFIVNQRRKVIEVKRSEGAKRAAKKRSSNAKQPFEPGYISPEYHNFLMVLDKIRKRQQSLERFASKTQIHVQKG